MQKISKIVLSLIKVLLIIIISLCLINSNKANVFAANNDICIGFSTCKSVGRSNYGYENNYSSSYWGAYSGHNCTNYVAYRLTMKGVAKPNMSMGDAHYWDNSARLLGYTVNTTPTVGSIAQWEIGSLQPNGHVAYVEEVGNGYIIISEDNWGGNFKWRRIETSGNWPHHFLHFSDQPTPTDHTLQFGNIGFIPLVGDWNGDGIDTLGVYNPSTAVFYLNDSNIQGSSVTTLQFGNIGFIPLVGDWNGDGIDTLGVYNPSTAVFYLKDSNVQGSSVTTLQFGNIGDIPIAGDWNGDGIDTLGIYRPSTAVFYLKDSNIQGSSVTTLQYGNIGDIPIVGDWNGDGVDVVGIYQKGTASFHWKE